MGGGFGIVLITKIKLKDFYRVTVTCLMNTCLNKVYDFCIYFNSFAHENNLIVLSITYFLCVRENEHKRNWKLSAQCSMEIMNYDEIIVRPRRLFFLCFGSRGRTKEREKWIHKKVKGSNNRLGDIQFLYWIYVSYLNHMSQIIIYTISNV